MGFLTGRDLLQKAASQIADVWGLMDAVVCNCALAESITVFRNSSQHSAEALYLTSLLQALPSTSK